MKDASHSRTFVFLTVLIVAIGITVRSLGYFSDINGFWWDEGAWAYEIGRGNYGIRPIGYALFVRVFVETWPSEVVLRLPSYLSGIAVVPLFGALLKTARVRPSVTLLGMAVMAVHPAAVAFSKEFKPYEMELLAHVVVLLATLRYFERPTMARLLATGGAALVGTLFSWTVPALAPFLLVPMIWQQKRDADKSQLRVTLGATAIGLLTVAAIFFLRVAGRKSSSGYWGKKYDVFALDQSFLGQVRWLGGKTWDLLHFPGDLHVVRGSAGLSLSDGLGHLFAGMVLLGIVVALWRRNFVQAGLFLGPWLVVIFANQIGLWPYGVFRTNLFLLAYTLALAALGFDFALERVRSERVESWLVGGLLVVMLPVDLAYFTLKARETGAESTSAPRALAFLEKNVRIEPGSRRKVSVLLDPHACAAVNYYRGTHPTWSKRFRHGLRPLVQMICLNEKKDPRFRYARGKMDREFWGYFVKPKVKNRLWKSVAPVCEKGSQLVLPTGDIIVHCVPPKSTAAKQP